MELAHSDTKSVHDPSATLFLESAITRLGSLPPFVLSDTWIGCCCCCGHMLSSKLAKFCFKMKLNFVGLVRPDGHKLWI